MTTYLVATNSVDTSAALCDYLQDRLTADDVVHAVNSLRGGDDTSPTDVREGEDALNVVNSRLLGEATVETHQFIRGSAPHEDLLAYAEEVDADELVLGIRKRNPTSKVVFGSTAQEILLNGNLPMVAVPLAAVE